MTKESKTVLYKNLLFSGIMGFAWGVMDQVAFYGPGGTGLGGIPFGLGIFVLLEWQYYCVTPRKEDDDQGRP